MKEARAHATKEIEMRIAIVEDEAVIRDGMANILQKIDPEYEVVGTAEDGERGYELIKRERPDLVIMDIRMPKMDGLTMLGKLWEEQISCRAIVLTAYSEFSYAKQAIDHGVDNYLLKPIKISELKRALQKTANEIRKVESQEKVLSLENIFMGCLTGQLEENPEMSHMMKLRYGFTMEEPVELFAVWLGDSYERQADRTAEILRRRAENAVGYRVFLQKNENNRMILMILYCLEEGKSFYQRYQKNVIPALERVLEKPVIYVWHRTQHLTDVSVAVKQMKKNREWNLYFAPETLISPEKINQWKLIPLKYPMELEEQAVQAMLKKNKRQLENCEEKLLEMLYSGGYSPKQIKETIVRFGWSLANKQWDRKETSELKIQKILGRLVEAVTWKEIHLEMGEFITLICGEQEQTEDNSVSRMVQKAKELIWKYYSEGITLEEAARKLFVSEEYLSTQFKKETGSSFTETVRHYKIEKVKQLLLDTPLKLNQIAELAGYSDPKYMSKVFKEEVGMLPSEFRKLVH